MLHALLRAGAPVWALLLLSSCSLAGPDDDLPAPRPAFWVSASAPDASPIGWEGVLTAMETVQLGSTGAQQGPSSALRLTFDGGARSLLVSGLDALDVPLAVGTRYGVRVHTRPMMNGFEGTLEMTDAAGLLLYARTEGKALDGDIPAPPAGLRLSLTPGRYAWADAGCGYRAVPQVLEAAREGRRVRLVQGQTQALPPYRLTVLVARKVERVSEEVCLDFAPEELSLVLVRE